jgi:hypothetical protein
MSTLGQRLANQTANEKANALAAQEAAARHLSEEALKNFQAVYQVFEDIKGVFTNAIEEGVPTAKHFVQIGGKNYAKSGLAQYYDIFSVIDGYANQGTVPSSMRGKGQYASLWNDLQDWARSNDLALKWENAWDGGGMDSWLTIRLQPAVLPSSQTAYAGTSLGTRVKANPAQALQTLVVLANTCEELASALRVLKGHSSAALALETHAQQISMARELKNDLR